MKKKLLFIFNPHSGKGLIKNKLLEIVDIMLLVSVEETQFWFQLIIYITIMADYM